MDSFLTFTLRLSTSTASEQPRDTDLSISIYQMHRANYFTFVLPLKMVQDPVPQNITFLMPNDRNLSSISLSTDEIPDFHWRHLSHFRTGLIIPTCKTQYMLRVSNGGRQRFCLNNVRLTSPNICSSGSSIKCHGIDGILEAQPCNQGCSSGPPSMAHPSFASPPPSLPNHTSLVTPPPITNFPTGYKSGCSDLVHGGVPVVHALIVTLILAGIVS